MEPFKIKVVEPIYFTTIQERKQILKKVRYNLFNIPSDKITIDLLTDSGTSAMSQFQWAKIFEGDESYAGATSFYKLEKFMQYLTNCKYIIPVHQGRAAERILFSILGGEGKIFISNTHFDTTRANIEFNKSTAIDICIPDALNPHSEFPFKGNIDLKRLELLIKKYSSPNIGAVILTLTNNSMGGQPVSFNNISETYKICKRYGINLFLDAARFAENSYFIKKYEKGFKKYPVKTIAQKIFRLCNGFLFSAKKDGLVNIGGLIGLKSEELYEKVIQNLIITEGFLTYGGLAGRDLEAIKQGIIEVLDEKYLEYRINQVRFLGEKLEQMNIPLVKPFGGHAVYINAGELLPHIKKREFPGHALACAIYLEGGIRTVEIGSVMFGDNAKLELVRIAIPRRVYTNSHLEYVAQTIGKVAQYKSKLCGFKIVKEPKLLRHFLAKFEPLRPNSIFP